MEYISADIVAFKKRLEESGTKGLVIDIDETLSNSALYMAGELGRLYGNPLNLSDEELFERLLDRNVPFWDINVIREWGQVAMESAEIVEKYSVKEGAGKAVSKINDIIPMVGYLTLRPESIKDVSARWLKKHGFPEVPVLARPNSIKLTDGSMGMQWKAAVLDYLYPQITGLIDDTLEIYTYLPSNYKGTIFLYNKKPRPKRELNTISCKTWDDVYREVVENKEVMRIAALRHESGNNAGPGRIQSFINIPLAESVDLGNLVEYNSGALVNLPITQSPYCNMTLFAIDQDSQGEAGKSHSTQGEAIMLILDGSADVTVGGKTFTVKKGESAVSPVNVPHSIRAKERFKMLMVLLNP